MPNGLGTSTPNTLTTPTTLETTPWYKSKTIISGIVAVAAGVAGIFGYATAPEDQEQLIELITIVGATYGGLGAIYGRITASKAIK